MLRAKLGQFAALAFAVGLVAAMGPWPDRQVEEKRAAEPAITVTAQAAAAAAAPDAPALP